MNEAKHKFRAKTRGEFVIDFVIEAAGAEFPLKRFQNRNIDIRLTKCLDCVLVGYVTQRNGPEVVA